MNKIHFILLLLLCNVTVAFCQADTAKATMHPDANTEYLDETGSKIDAIKFMQTMGSGGYTMLPQIADGHIKSLRLKKTENKVSLGSAAPDFTVADIKGHTYTLSSLKGKTVILNFWFVNCAGCVQEMPDLNKLAAKYKNDASVVFLAITFDEATKVKAFLAKHPFSYTIVADQAALVQQYGIEAFPFSLVIDKTGHIAFSNNSGASGVAEQLGNVIDMIK